MKTDIDALRARLLHPKLTAEELESIMALLSCIEERENPTTYATGEAEWAQRIAVAEQRFVDEYDARKAFRRGAEAMREACAARIGSDPALLVSLRSHCESALRALPIPEEP